MNSRVGTASQCSIIFLAGDLASGGGINRVIRDLSSIFAERFGATIAVFSFETTKQPTYPFPDAVTIRSSPAHGVAGLWKVIRSVRRAKPDFAIGSWTGENMALILGLLFSRTKVIVVEHQSWHFWPRWLRALRRLIYPLAWRVVVLNPREITYYSRFLRNLRLMTNPVPAMANNDSGAREKLVLAIGHLEPRKNFIDAIRAMTISRLEKSGWELVIIGSGPEQRMLEDAIASAGLKRTRIVPPTNDLASWYNRASLMLLPSTLDLAPLVLAEAMSAGVVPVAYDVDGAGFILEDFPDQIVPVGDVGALAERMRQLATAGIPHALRPAMRASVERRFSPDLVAQRWLELLNET